MDQCSFSSILFFIFGLVFGSFGNVLIYRIPAGFGIDGRSQCPKCQKTIRAVDLIPVVSYLLLRGKCRNCSQKISLQYPLIEFSSAILFVAAYCHADDVLIGAILAMALWFLLLITAIDFFTQGIPDILNIPFIAVSLVYGAMLGHLQVLAFAVCTGFFALQWIVSKGRWVGSGDILLSVGIAALLGRWELTFVMLCSAYISGSLVAMYLISKKRSSAKDRLAFAPFLALGTLVALFAGDWILKALFYT